MKRLGRGGSRIQTWIGLLITSTEQKLSSWYQNFLFPLSLSMFGTQGDEKQSVFIREEPFCAFVRPAGLI